MELDNLLKPRWKRIRVPAGAAVRLFAVLDGSDALRSVLKEFFKDAVIQRCLVHKERNIRSKLSKRHWGELARLFKGLREVQGKEASKKSM